ncbi:MAG: hypothetical protein OXH52_12525, partial [Gammaproteobacteria bacterium]|nr:hypothetical protein [Gammaproteobacteria bacterium]
CLARCISPVAAVFSRLGTSDAVFRARAGFPRQTPDCSRRVRLPGLPGIPRFTAVAATVNAELLRRAQDALDFRVAPARPSKDGSKAPRTIQASSAGHQLNLQVPARRHRVRVAFRAPSLPDARDYCRLRSAKV